MTINKPAKKKKIKAQCCRPLSLKGNATDFTICLQSTANGKTVEVERSELSR